VVEAQVLAAKEALERAIEELPEKEAHSLAGHIAGVRAYQSLYREEIPRVIELAGRALESLPEESSLRGLTSLALGWALRFTGDLAGASQAFVEARSASLTSGNRYAAVAATCRLAYTQMLGGQLGQAAETCREALQMATGAGGRYLPVAGYALVYLGNVYREWNEPEAAAGYLQDGIELCAQVGYIMDQVVGQTTLARVRLAEQDWAGAHQALKSAEQLSQKMKGYVLTRRLVEDCQVRLWSAGGRLTALSRWLQETDLRPEDAVGFGRELEHLILARALVAVGRAQPQEPYLDEALALLDRLLETAEPAGWRGKAIEILVLQAMACQAQGGIEEAFGALEGALSTGGPEGYVRVFVDEGPPMARLLREAAARGIAPDYTRRLMAALEGTSMAAADANSRRAMKETAIESAARPSPSISSGRQALIEPLSERELEVLRLIAEGLSNREIAERLFLALSTVKVHTRNIYGKMDVHSRTQAVTKGRQMGLL
jgi:LuxR family maltose regulon positive regulatory protein